MESGAAAALRQMMLKLLSLSQVVYQEGIELLLVNEWTGVIQVDTRLKKA